MIIFSLFSGTDQNKGRNLILTGHPVGFRNFTYYFFHYYPEYNAMRILTPIVQRSKLRLRSSNLFRANRINKLWTIDLNLLCVTLKPMLFLLN